jgi:carbamoyl-phosphate synthase large subunit
METKKFNIAVTGVGGGVGQSVLKSLNDSNYHVIGLDGEFLGAGLYAVPDAYKIPYANAGNYIEELLKICEMEKCHLLFPGLDAELSILSKNREKFKAIGTHVVVSDNDVIEVSDNKMQTYQRLTAAGIHVPLTFSLDDFNIDKLNFPFIIKQKIGGARSKNVFLIKDENGFRNFISNPENKPAQFVAQEYVNGDEYTCGTINMNNECMGVIVMRRILRDGDTYKCFVEKNELIEETVRKVMDELKPHGACNVQLRLKDGIPFVFEINARCSGTTASRTLCGFNEPLMIADYILQGKTPSFTIQTKTILRYWNELEVENELIERMRSENHLAGMNPKNL